MTEALQVVLGALLPPVIDLVNNKIADSKVRYLVSIIFCTVLAFLVEQITNDATTLGRLFEGSTTVFLSAQTIYKLYWENSSLRASLK